MDILDPRDLFGRVVGITGTRTAPNEAQAEFLMRQLTGLRKVRGFVTGAALGIDHHLGLWLAQAYPETPQLVIVPANRRQIVRWWLDAHGNGLFDNVKVRLMPPGTSYAERNQAIVQISTALLGFPPASEAAMAGVRSGTMQTIRMARAADVPTYVFPLSEMVGMPAVVGPPQAAPFRP